MMVGRGKCLSKGNLLQMAFPRALVLLFLANMAQSRMAASAPDDASDSQNSAFGNLPPASVSRFVPETSNSWRGNDALRFSSTVARPLFHIFLFTKARLRWTAY